MLHQPERARSGFLPAWISHPRNPPVGPNCDARPAVPLTTQELADAIAIGQRCQAPIIRESSGRVRLRDVHRKPVRTGGPCSRDRPCHAPASRRAWPQTGDTRPLSDLGLRGILKLRSLPRLLASRYDRRPERSCQSANATNDCSSRRGWSAGSPSEPPHQNGPARCLCSALFRRSAE
jgi:hypothetical protein